MQIDIYHKHIMNRLNRKAIIMFSQHITPTEVLLVDLMGGTISDFGVNILRFYVIYRNTDKSTKYNTCSSTTYSYYRGIYNIRKL